MVHVLLTITEVRRQIGASLDYKWSEDASTLNLRQDKLQDGIWLDSPASVRLVVRNGGDRLLIDGEVSLDLKLLCGRCLAEYREGVHYPIEEQFLFARHAGQAGQVKDGEDEDKELAVLEGDSIDATGLVRDAVLSNLPMKPLCQEDCQGLCPDCGQDLNQEACSCTNQEVDPRLAALGKWTIKEGELI